MVASIGELELPSRRIAICSAAAQPADRGHHHEHRQVRIERLHFDRFSSTPLECSAALVEYERWLTASLDTGEWGTFAWAGDRAACGRGALIGITRCASSSPVWKKKRSSPKAGTRSS